MKKSCILLLFIAFSCGPPHTDIPDYVKNLDDVRLFTINGREGNITFEREITFGDSDEILIGEISNINVDTQGHVYLSDKNNYAVHLFHSGGHYITSFGRQGSGPGEFRDITSVELYADKIFIYDAALLRINIFETDIEQVDKINFLKMISLSEENWDRVQAEISDFYPIHFAILNEGEFMLGSPDSLTPESFRDERKVSYFFFDENGEVFPERFFEQKATAYLNIEPTIFNFPFLRTSILKTTKSNQIISAWTEDFLIKKHDSSGAYLEAFYYPIDRPALSMNKVIQTYAEKDGDLYIKKERERVLRDISLPETWPAINDLIIDNENRLWVSTIVENFNVYEWWVLKETGELITKFEWPRDETIEVIKNGFMYTRETDEETGLQQIVRYGVDLEER